MSGFIMVSESVYVEKIFFDKAIRQKVMFELVHKGSKLESVNVVDLQSFKR